MRLKEAINRVDNIERKGFELGLTVKDYRKLKNLLVNEVSPYAFFDENWHKLYERIDELLNKIYNSGILFKYSPANCEYILENSSLLPLVLANNTYYKVRMYDNNSYMFMCQFHNENTPSMGVSDIENLLFCYGCGQNLNVISYLEKYECISYIETIELLSSIYLYGLDNKVDNASLKYRNAILSNDYLNLLNAGYDRLNDIPNSKFSKETIEKHYENKFKMIERIRNNIIDPNFIYEQPPKKMILK